MTIEELRTEMQAGFKKVDEEFVVVRAEMKAGFSRVDDEFKSVRAEIKAEGGATRRHFDIIAEDMKDLIKIVAEATAQKTQRLNDHETRLTKLEKPRE